MQDPRPLTRVVAVVISARRGGCSMQAPHLCWLLIPNVSNLRICLIRSDQILHACRLEGINNLPTARGTQWQSQLSAQLQLLFRQG